MTLTLRSELEVSLHSLPRFRLLEGPTPLVAYPRLARAIGVQSLFVKHDDLTGTAFGGNKTRELELFLGAAVHEGADVFVAGGGVSQSNHARQCAAAARRAGLDAHLVLRKGNRANTVGGNQLVTQLMADRIIWVDDDPGLDDRERLADAMDRHAVELSDAGRSPWVLHSSFHPLGAAAYAGAGLELDDQLRAADIEGATVVVTSMGATRVGLDIAARAIAAEWRVLGAAWRPSYEALPADLAALADETAALLGLDLTFETGDFPTVDKGGPAYGVPNDEGLAALRLAARTEGLLLDPVYTAKGFAALIDGLGAEIPTDQPVVFLHTGGLPALFAYAEELLGQTKGLMS